MTKSKIIAVALTTLTLASTFMTFGHEAQAHPRWGWGVGAGFAAGALIGAAAANSYAYGYRDCYWVQRVDSWGNLRSFKVCDRY